MPSCKNFSVYSLCFFGSLFFTGLIVLCLLLVCQLGSEYIYLFFGGTRKSEQKKGIHGFFVHQ